MATLQELTHRQIEDAIRAGAEKNVPATEKAREYFVGYPPSSPAVALLKDGGLVYMMERHQIEGHTHQEIAEALKAAFNEHCAG